MGASGWQYVVEYQADIAEALNRLRHRVFSEGSYLSPAELGLPAPESVDDLVTEPYWEFMGTSGTHSILDVLELAPADDPDQDYGTVRPLTGPEYLELFGTSQPGHGDFDQARDAGRLDELVYEGPGTGRAAVLWAGGVRAEIAFWGYSGD